jgi:hypothetical protein
MVTPGKAPQPRPLAGAMVIVHAGGADGDELARQATGADGTFEFTLAPGTYTLTAQQWQAMPQTVTVKPGEYVTVTLEIAAG